MARYPDMPGSFKLTEEGLSARPKTELCFFGMVWSRFVERQIMPSLPAHLTSQLAE